MNTVDALKKLYKTLTGNDWPYDTNPTDAEVIDKIAADGNAGGGSGSGGGDRIEIMIPWNDGSIDPLPTGLTVSDFKDVALLAVINDTIAMCRHANYIYYGNNMHVFIQSDRYSPDSGEGGSMETVVLEYNPETGEVSIVS